ncbi:MAG: hypothetical protein WCK73_17435 [Deltaproteobacteria bacterium]
MEPITSVIVAPTADRKTAPSSFGATLRSMANGAADGIAAATGLIGPIAPAGMVLAGAVRSLAQASAPSLRLPTAGGTTPTSTATSSTTGGDAFDAARLLQQESQSFNLQYLELQERMQRETREFTAVSNVMKVRHDAARAAIQNVQ